MDVIACAFRWGVAVIGKNFYWVLLTSSWNLLLDTWGCTGRRHSDEVVTVKEADVWPRYFLCKKYFV